MWPPQQPQACYVLSVNLLIQRLQNFARIMQERLDAGDIRAKKAYLRSVIAQIEVGDDKVRIVGEKASLAAVIAGTPPENAHVRGFVRKWRARRDSNP